VGYQLAFIEVHASGHVPIGHLVANDVGDWSTHCDLGCAPTHANKLGRTYALVEPALNELINHLHFDHGTKV
jgi:hypothetical protein